MTIIRLQFTHKNFKIRYLISLRSRYLMLLPSTLMSPWWISMILNRAWNRLDLPDPVLPTMPTFSVGLVQKVTPFRASDRSLLYRKCTFLKETTPIVGQNGETWNDLRQMNLLYPVVGKYCLLNCWKMSKLNTICKYNNINKTMSITYLIKTRGPFSPEKPVQINEYI